jgi:pseudomonalisin
MRAISVTIKQVVGAFAVIAALLVLGEAAAEAGPAQTLAPGQTLARGAGMYSANGRYFFVMQDDGNLVLYRTNGRALWATGTDGRAIRHAVMQNDGNLVLYDYAGRPRWASGTNGQWGSYLVVQDDGNVVIYRPLSPIWASNSQRTSEHCDPQTTLQPGAVLARGSSVRSANGKYNLVMQDDGNLVLYQANGPALWATGTNGIAIRHAVMQRDGNLVLYDYAGRPRWASGTHGNPGALLYVQCDGNVVIYKPNVPVWATNTVQR